MKKNRGKGFTLIELLIVVAIIGILAAIAIPNFLQAQVRAKVARVQSDQRALATALETYFVDHNTFPPDHYCYGAGCSPAPYAPQSWEIRYLLQLSTPIDYVQNTGGYVDPFNATSTVPPYDNPTYLYFAGMENHWGGAVSGAAPDRLPTQACLIKSFGPDQFDQGGEWVLTGMDGGGGGPMNNYDRIYDPTNGTISRGDMVRAIGQIKGLQQSYGG